MRAESLAIFRLGVKMPAVLTSWKEIASHLGKSIRTVQRWERELGLPVRRPDLRRSGIVLADPTELDAWLHRQSTLGPLPEEGNGDRGHAESSFHQRHERLSELRQRTDLMVGKTHVLYEDLLAKRARLRTAVDSHREVTRSLRALTARHADRAKGQPAA